MATHLAFPIEAPMEHSYSVTISLTTRLIDTTDHFQRNRVYKNVVGSSKVYISLMER
jgi:hypothetical protein